MFRYRYRCLHVFGTDEYRDVPMSVSRILWATAPFAVQWQDVAIRANIKCLASDDG
jgi:hypothetical protein